jgi:DNA-binding MarR family transcriptional regulator
VIILPLDDSRYNDYRVLMKRRLQEEIRQSKPFPTLEEEVYLELQRTAQVAARWIALALKPWGLSESQFNVLRILRGAGADGLPSARVGERMVRHDPDLTRLLDRLETAGLIEKVRDTQDRRVVTARITRAGLRVVERASEAVRASAVAALRPMGPRKLQTLADLLESARGGVTLDRPPEPEPPPSTRSSRTAAPRPHP